MTRRAVSPPPQTVAAPTHARPHDVPGPVGEGEAFFRAILASLNEGVLVTDAEDRIHYVNDTMEEIGQRPCAAMVGPLSAELFIRPEDRARFRQRHRERLQGRSETSKHEQLLPDGRRRWIRLRSSPLSGPDGQIVGRVALLSCVDEPRALALEHDYLRNAVRAPSAQIFGDSAAIREVLDQIPLVAPTEATVLIAATNRDLAAVKAGRFRGDLYFRVNVFPIALPPLCERLGNIPLLARHFLEGAARHLGQPIPALGDAEICALITCDWPGNVRELKNVIERATILAQRGPFRLDLLPAAPPPPSPATREPGAPQAPARWETQERAMLDVALIAAHRKRYGRDGAAARLGLPPTRLTSTMKRQGLQPPR